MTLIAISYPGLEDVSIPLHHGKKPKLVDVLMLLGMLLLHFQNVVSDISVMKQFCEEKQVSGD